MGVPAQARLPRAGEFRPSLCGLKGHPAEGNRLTGSCDPQNSQVPQLLPELLQAQNKESFQVALGPSAQGVFPGGSADTPIYLILVPSQR